jgi:hypothetical protein
MVEDPPISVLMRAPATSDVLALFPPVVKSDEFLMFFPELTPIIIINNKVDAIPAICKKPASAISVS